MATQEHRAQALEDELADKKERVSKMKSFLNTSDEWHAFVIGISEVLCPWPPNRRHCEEHSNEAISNEYHYYLFGRVMGIIAWIVIAKIIQEAFF